MLVTLIIFLVTLSILVIVHELGHYLSAKSIGVEVESFAIGFPPKIWAKKIGETIYQINALPLGGYVKLKGEFEEDQKSVTDKKNLLSRSPLEHLYIFIAGVVMNFLLGILFLAVAFTFGTTPIMPGMPDYKGLERNEKVVIEGVEAGGTADKEGIEPGDEIITINGVGVKTDAEVIREIQKLSLEQKANIEIKRGEQGINKSVSIGSGKISDEKGQVIEGKKIGVTLSSDRNVKATPLIALKVAFLESLRILRLTFMGIISLFALLFTKFRLSDEVSGPVGIFIATGYFARLGFTVYLQFMAIISLSLALFNVLPIPALDGGQIFFTLLEVVTRRKFSHRTKNVIQFVGFALLITLMLFVTVKELINFNIINNILNIFKG